MARMQRSMHLPGNSAAPTGSGSYGALGAGRRFAEPPRHGTRSSPDPHRLSVIELDRIHLARWPGLGRLASSSSY